MEEDDVRARAEALCAGLVAGDVDRVTADLSEELRRNLGEVLALLVLPSVEATVESVERSGGSGAYATVLRLAGPTEEVQIQLRWKERDGHPTVIEASHLSRVEVEAAAQAEEGGDEEGGADAGS